MPPKQFTRTQLRVTDIHESDDTLQAAASTAKRTTPTVFPAAEIDNDDDDDLYDVLGGQWNRASPINNASGDHCAQVTDEDRLEVATQNLLMLEMLREKQAQWKAEQRFEWDQWAPTWERMAVEWDQWATERADPTEWSTVGTRPNSYMMVDPVWYCGSAKELDRFRDA